MLTGSSLLARSVAVKVDSGRYGKAGWVYWQHVSPGWFARLASRSGAACCRPRASLEPSLAGDGRVALSSVAKGSATNARSRISGITF